MVLFFHGAGEDCTEPENGMPTIADLMRRNGETCAGHSSAFVAARCEMKVVREIGNGGFKLYHDAFETLLSRIDALGTEDYRWGWGIKALAAVRMPLSDVILGNTPRSQPRPKADLFFFSPFSFAQLMP